MGCLYFIYTGRNGEGRAGGTGVGAGRASDAIRRPWGARRSAEWRYLRADAQRPHMSVYERVAVSLRRTGGWGGLVSGVRRVVALL